MHVFSEKDKSINIIIPASGVVTALEPVLRACNGTWIERIGQRGPRKLLTRGIRFASRDQPSYTLRRVCS